jgi:hypothetical protein
LQLVAFQNLA